MTYSGGINHASTITKNTINWNQSSKISLKPIKNVSFLFKSIHLIHQVLWHWAEDHMCGLWGMQLRQDGQVMSWWCFLFRLCYCLFVNVHQMLYNVGVCANTVHIMWKEKLFRTFENKWVLYQSFLWRYFQEFPSKCTFWLKVDTFDRLVSTAASAMWIYHKMFNNRLFGHFWKSEILWQTVCETMVASAQANIVPLKEEVCWKKKLFRKGFPKWWWWWQRLLYQNKIILLPILKISMKMLQRKDEKDFDEERSFQDFCAANSVEKEPRLCFVLS